MEEENKTRLTDPHSRLELFLFSNWRTIVTIAMALGGWYSANIYQRVKVIPTLVSNDSTRAARLTETITIVAEMKDQIVVNGNLILILSRIECARLSGDDRGKYGIDCKQIPLPNLVR